MRLSHKELVEQEVVDETICNCCGETIIKYAGCLNAYIQWDYANDIFPEELHQYSLCEKCIENQFKTFKHAPLGFSNCNNQKDAQHYFDQWKKNNNK
jgi:hypothetical protein